MVQPLVEISYGQSRIVENLLYAYTEPFDVVVDPFAGGGSTIDICALSVTPSTMMG